MGACEGIRGERTSEEVNEGESLVFLNKHLIKVSCELKSYLGVVRAFIRELMLDSCCVGFLEVSKRRSFDK